jgi:broad specificity phosphatase PhoE
MSEIYFIRHGQASFMAQDYDRLSPLGIRQADIVADHLIDRKIHFDVIYSGHMKRQRDTANPLCSRYRQSGTDDIQQPIILPAFNEYDARALIAARVCIAEGDDVLSDDDLLRIRQDRNAFQAYFTQTVYGWLDGRYDGQPDVEPWSDFRSRVGKGVEDIMTRNGRGGRVAVFTSGGPISVAVQIALGLSHRKTVELSWQIMNASITIIKYNSAGMVLSVFNNTTPLRMADDPALLTYR